MLYQILQFILWQFKMNFSFLEMLNLSLLHFYHHLLLINLRNFHEMNFIPYHLIQFLILEFINLFNQFLPRVSLFFLVITIYQLFVFLKILLVIIFFQPQHLILNFQLVSHVIHP